MKKYIEQIEQAVIDKSVYSKSQSDTFGEVFTPNKLINEMLDKLPAENFKDKNKTFFDPASGNGNFHTQVLKRLFKNLKSEIPDERERYKHIIEKQLYFAEFQYDNAKFIYDTFSKSGEFKVNLYVGDTLKMPPDFFGWSLNIRTERWPEHIITEIEKKKLNKVKPLNLF